MKPASKLANVQNKFKVMLTASEAVPFCKTGGLADAVGALALHLAPWAEVALFLPKYKSVDAKNFLSPGAPFSVPLAGQMEKVRLFKTKIPGQRKNNPAVYFVDHPELFEREGLYAVEGRDYPDNSRRFTLFSRAALEGARSIGLRPDIIHCHDWQTGLIPAYLKTLYHSDPFYDSTAAVMTIHNVAYQGVFPYQAFEEAGFPGEEFRMEKFEFHGKINFLKAGIVYADSISTVSPTYAKEIQRSDQGAGLEGVIQNRQDAIAGILNGIDIKLWNPVTDPHIFVRYDLSDAQRGFKAKMRNKALLQESLGLNTDPRAFLLGMVSRLDHQKGVDWVAQVLPHLLDQGDLQCVILGAGDPELQKILRELAGRRPKCFRAIIEFNDPLARQIYAASDCFLMPSRFEPCGLAQMIAMRYGTLPIVSKTGGLADTVTPDKGFILEEQTAAALVKEIEEAAKLWRKEPGQWQEMALRAAQTDFSWTASIQRYLELYRRALGRTVRPDGLTK
ncbi:MAG: glycogen synthase [Elusimicrobia bacterium]|nr:glycogen synthase [Elusimicrobiota bacterium]